MNLVIKSLLYILVILSANQSFGFTEIFAVNELRMRVTQPDLYKCAMSTENFWQLKVVNTPLDSSKPMSPDNTYRLRYSQFGCELGVNGPVVMVPGRTEGSLDYYEMAEEYYNRGFSPVFVMDPRGQGFSPRLLDNPQKGHVKLFSDYTYDLKYMVDEAVIPALEDLGWKLGDKLYLTSNSMGGGIALSYFQLVGDDNPFKAGVFVAAMININYASFLPLPQTPELYEQFSEANVNALTTPRCADPESELCQDYPQELLAGKPSGDYLPGSRIFKEDVESMMTNSPYRYAIREMLWEEIDWTDFKSAHFEAKENWHGLQLGAATNGWVHQSTIANPALRDPMNVAKMKKDVPIMLLSGSRDLRIYRVFYDYAQNIKTDLKHHYDFCKTVNSSSKGASCVVYPINGGFHELYKETDRDGLNYRETAFSAAIGFFKDSK